jgi:azurin
MKFNSTLLPLRLAAIASVAFLTNCGKEEKGVAPPAAAAETPAVEVEVARDDLPVKEIEVSANDEMKFSVGKIDAKPRQKIELIFKNKGTLPKDAMGHNWCLLHLKVDAVAFLEAGFSAPGNDYVATENEKYVIVRTKLLGPGESETVTFIAPSTPGSYPYICTFPGHFAAGMKGVLSIGE